MAYATVGGFAAPMGLWSGAVPTIIGSVFSRTVLMVTTLTSAIALSAGGVLTGAGLDPGDAGAVAALSVMTGLWMVLLGALKLGSVMSFVSTAVMTGFTAGIAVQIVAGVVEDATGYGPQSHNTIGKLVEALWHVGDWDAPTVAVAAATIAAWAVLSQFKRIRKTATLASLLLVSVVVALAGIDVDLIYKIGQYRLDAQGTALDIPRHEESDAVFVQRLSGMPTGPRSGVDAARELLTQDVRNHVAPQSAPQPEIDPLLHPNIGFGQGPPTPRPGLGGVP